MASGLPGGGDQHAVKAQLAWEKSFLAHIGRYRRAVPTSPHSSCRAAPGKIADRGSSLYSLMARCSRKVASLNLRPRRAAVIALGLAGDAAAALPVDVDGLDGFQAHVHRAIDRRPSLLEDAADAERLVLMLRERDGRDGTQGRLRHGGSIRSARHGHHDPDDAQRTAPRDGRPALGRRPAADRSRIVDGGSRGAHAGRHCTGRRSPLRRLIGAPALRRSKLRPAPADRTPQTRRTGDACHHWYRRLPCLSLADGMAVRT